jgi:hypothetical protein
MHFHLSIHCRRRREMRPGLIALALAEAKPSESGVAVGDQRAHAEFFVKGQCFPVSMLRPLEVTTIGTGRDLPEE